MRYREFPYMQFVKRLEHKLAHEKDDYVSLSSNQPPEPEMSDLGIDLTKADFSWSAPYTSDDIKRPVAAHYGVKSGQVMSVVGGSSFANFLSAALFVNPGDEVIVENPVYDALTGVVEILGGKVKFLDRDPARNYEIEIEKLSALVTSKTKLFFLTNPHNPSGVEISEKNMRQLVDFSSSTGIRILVDEVYLDHVVGSKAAASYGKGLIHTSSLTKVYGLGSWRFGWIIADEDLIKRYEYFYDLMGVSPPTIINWLAMRVLPKLDKMRESVWGRYEEGRELMDSFVKDCGLWWIKPTYCPFGFVKLPGGIEDMKLQRNLKEKHKVLIASGSFFNSPGWVRLGWFSPLEKVKRGLDAIREELAL